MLSSLSPSRGRSCVTRIETCQSAKSLVQRRRPNASGDGERSLVPHGAEEPAGFPGVLHALPTGFGHGVVGASLLSLEVGEEPG